MINRIPLSVVADNAQAIFNVWFVGDQFIKDVHNTYKAIIDQTSSKSTTKKTDPPPYTQEQFNVRMYYKQFTSGVRYAATRMINSLLDALNEQDRLPKYLVIVPDKDLLYDIDVFEFGAHKVLADVLQWMLKEMLMFIRHRKLDLLDKKPGAVVSEDPMVILVRMLRRQERFKPDSKIDKICSLRAKFNDSLNEQALKLGYRILTINSCKTMDHFNKWGNLPVKGLYAFAMK